MCIKANRSGLEQAHIKHLSVRLDKGKRVEYTSKLNCPFLIKKKKN